MHNQQILKQPLKDMQKQVRANKFGALKYVIKQYAWHVDRYDLYPYMPCKQTQYVTRHNLYINTPSNQILPKQRQGL